jgi:hypothetical protein
MTKPKLFEAKWLVIKQNGHIIRLIEAGAFDAALAKAKDYQRKARITIPEGWRLVCLREFNEVIR